MTAQIRLYLELGALAVLLIAFALFVHHERTVGEQKIEASDSKATAAVNALAAAQTQHAAELSTQAQQAAQHEQNAINAYSAAHTVGVVRLCSNTNDSGPSVPKTSPVAGGVAGSSTGPAPLSAVSAGPDIGPALGELMLDAARLADLYSEYQHR